MSNIQTSDYISSPLNAIVSEASFLVITTVKSQILSLVGVFDYIPEEKHTVSVGTTDYPIETGATLTDHAFIKPLELEMLAVVSDILVQRFTTLLTPYRDREGWERILLQIQRRNLVTVVTLLKTYNNLILTDVSVDKDQSTGRSLVARLKFKEALIANTQTTELPESNITGAADNQASTVNNGVRQAQEGSSAQKDTLSIQTFNAFTNKTRAALNPVTPGD